MRTLHASELGSFLYCQRAWWYRRQGIEPQNQAELNAGSIFHQEHARGVKLVLVLRWVALFLLILAAALAAIQVIR